MKNKVAPLMQMNGSKTKVVLVRVPYSFEIYKHTYKKQMSVGAKQVEPPLALMQVGAYALRAGADLRIIDGEAENLSLEEIVERIMFYQPDIIGFTSTTPESHAIKILAELIKPILPQSLIVVGGAHATHVPWMYHETTEAIDLVVVYEGEKAFKAIVENNQELLKEYADNALALLESKEVPNPRKYYGKIILGPSMGKADLETNFPVREAPYIDTRFYLHATPSEGLVRLESLETARGCPFGCSFCSSARSGLGLRSVESVLEEIEYINSIFKRENVKGCLLFLDDTLTVNRERSIALFEGMLKKNIKVTFKSFTRANTIASKYGHEEDVKFARLMKKCGSSIISFGIESGSERINEDMQKNVTLDDYRNAYKILDEVGFEEKRGSFIVGHPYETEESIKESINFALEVGLHRVGVNIMTPYPGTRVYEYAQQGKGIYFEKDANDYAQYRRWGKSIISTDELNPEALQYWHSRFLNTVYSSYHPVKQSLKSALSGNLSGYYHRPTLQAVGAQIKMRINGTWSAKAAFPKPDHSDYNPEDWGLPHITKQDCINILSSLYGMKRSRKEEPAMAVIS